MIAASPLERLTLCLRGNFAGPKDWFELIATANEHYVTSFLHRSLRDRSGAAEPDAASYLAELDAANRSRNRQIWDMTCEVVRTCNAAGMVPVLIKGASEMALLQDPSDYPRIMIDVDLLLAPADLEAGFDVLDSLDFVPLDDSEFDHSPGSYWRPGAMASVDLHSGLPERIACLLTEGELCFDPTKADPAANGGGRMRLIERDGAQMLLPDASLRFLINIAHDMLHHSTLASGATSLRYLLMLAAQMEDQRDPLDWDWIATKLSHPRFRLALDLQLLMLRHLFDVEAPLPLSPGRYARFLHQRRLLKMRFPQLGQVEWNVLRAAQSLGRLPRKLLHRVRS